MRDELTVLLKEYVDVLRELSLPGSEITNPAFYQGIAEDIDNFLQGDTYYGRNGKLGVYDPDLLKIERMQESTTQACVKVSYPGVFEEVLGDKMVLSGQKNALGQAIWESAHGDWVWVSYARSKMGLRPLSEVLSKLQEANTKIAGRIMATVFLRNQDSESQFRRNLSRLYELQGRSILTGYRHAEGGVGDYVAVKKDVEHISHELWADLVYSGAIRIKDDSLIDQPSASVLEKYNQMKILERVLDSGKVCAEVTEHGSTIERSKTTEALFYQRHALKDGWIELPTGQEPFTMVRANLNDGVVATYSEGDYYLEVAPNKDAMLKVLNHAIEFYSNHVGSKGYHIPDGLVEYGVTATTQNTSPAL